LSFGAVGGQRYVMALEAKGALDGLADGGLVVDDQDAHRAQGRA
jgi:hypothetical protein